MGAAAPRRGPVAHCPPRRRVTGHRPGRPRGGRGRPTRLSPSPRQHATRAPATSPPAPPAPAPTAELFPADPLQHPLALTPPIADSGVVSNRPACSTPSPSPPHRRQRSCFQQARPAPPSPYRQLICRHRTSAPAPHRAGPFLADTRIGCSRTPPTRARLSRGPCTDRCRNSRTHPGRRRRCGGRSATARAHGLHATPLSARVGWESGEAAVGSSPAQQLRCRRGGVVACATTPLSAEAGILACATTPLSAEVRVGAGQWVGRGTPVRRTASSTWAARPWWIRWIARVITSRLPPSRRSVSMTIGLPKTTLSRARGGGT